MKGLGLALALMVVAAPAASAATRTYSGTSSIDTPVTVRVADGKARLSIGYVAPCDNGETLRGTFRFKPAKLTEGVWAVKGPSSGTLPDGRTTASTLRLSGRLARRKARGTFAITTQMARPDGAGVATCRSGRVTWKASR